MKTEKFNKVTIMTVEDPEKMYLILKNVENSEKLIGKPTRIILSNTGMMPEFEEREVTE